MAWDMHGEMVAERAVIVEARRSSGIDQHAVARRKQALLIVLLDTTNTLELDQQKIVLSWIEPDIPYRPSHHMGVCYDLNQIEAGGVEYRDASREGMRAIFGVGAEAPASRLKVQSQLVQ
jgi:hypothetical protein